MREIMKNKIITLKMFRNGEFPKTLYHFTQTKNVKSILENGLIHNIAEDKKQFNWCEQAVYLAPSEDLLYDFCELVS